MAPKTITGTVVKAEADSKVGIAFSQIKDSPTMTIKFIREGGLFATTGLVPGLQVVSVAGEPVEGKTCKEAAELLRASPAGEVSVVAKGIVGTVTKETPETKCGISLLRDGDSKDVLVTSMAEGGLFSSTPIEVGQKVVSINGKPCPGSTKEAIKLIREAEGTFSIVTVSLVEEEEEEEKPDPEPVAAPEQAPSVEKEDPVTEEEDDDEEQPEDTPRTLEEDADVTVDTTASKNQGWLDTVNCCF